jgi:molybdenum cofactor cytidylyltransferase
VEPLLVVLGHHAAEIEQQVHLPAAAQFLRNPDYHLGQLSSLRVALRHLQAHPVAGALVCLVDHPAVTKTVVRELLGRFRQSDHAILIPVWRGRRGHPVLFARRLFEELLRAPLEQGARFVVHQHASEVELVQVEEEGITWDVDRPEDYTALERRWEAISAAGARPAGELP